MLVEIVKENKKDYMDLLLLADEQEDMIDKYLEEGDMFALYDNDLKIVAVIKKINDEVIEIKNIATYEKYHIIKSFFIDNYNNKIIEDGIKLIDMIYLKKYLE
jgi:hypothetical protein